MSPLALSLRFLEKQPDSRLAELAAAGHERAFEALVQRYRLALLGYCRRFFPSDAGAEDVLQQALLQAWMALSREKAEVRDVRPWLYRIVHNVAISNLRRPVDGSFRDDVSRTAIGPDEEMERRAAAREALAGLAALPEPQRQVMFSTALEGRSHEEIAAGLGLSPGAVRGLIYRARATLRSAAAAIVPGPLLHWLVRRAGERGSAAGPLEAVAGGGAAGVAGLVLKGGAVVIAAGAIVAGTGITSHRGPRQGGAQGSRVHSSAARVPSGDNRTPGGTGFAAQSAAARAQGASTAAVGASGPNVASAGGPGTQLGAGQQTSSTGTRGPGSGAGTGGSNGTQPIMTSGSSGATTSGSSEGGGGGSGEGGSSSGSSGSSGGGGHHDGGSTGTEGGQSSSEGSSGGSGSTSGGSGSTSGGSGSTSGGGSGKDGGGGSGGSSDGGSGRD